MYILNCSLSPKPWNRLEIYFKHEGSSRHPSKFQAATSYDNWLSRFTYLLSDHCSPGCERYSLVENEYLGNCRSMLLFTHPIFAPRLIYLQCVKAALFLTYQVVTAHAQRFKRWASIKANKILNIIDTIFWFALFIITIMGTSGAHSMSSRALGGIIATLSFFLWLVTPLKLNKYSF